MRTPYPQRVPSAAEVVPGAAVNVVLKADQPTGRTVSGTVRDVLTRGNHPRGIKVRLADGRVGRVQSLAAATGSAVAPTGGAAEAGGQLAAFPVGGLGAVSEGFGASRDGERGSRPAGGGAGRIRHRDVRLEDGADDPPQEIGLDAYIVPGRSRRQGNRRGQKPFAGVDGGGDGGGDGDEPGAVPAAPSQTAACPVCGEFEGDEAAVAHHVASHFDS